jgi:GntR family transcriptional regulator, rspAB operon transcriptional repressor
MANGEESTNGSVATEASPEPLRHLSLPDVVRLTLRRRIINNELPAGSRLLETKLAEEFGVSRTTLRSALRELKNDGLVEISPRRGCFVARMDPDDIHDICFARYVLEAGASAEAQVDDGVLEALEQALGAMTAGAQLGDLEAIVKADTRLHGVLVKAGGGRRVVQLWHELDGQMGSLMRSSLERQGVDLDEAVQRHRKFVDAIATKRRARIVKAIREHYLDPVLPPEARV